MLTTLYQVGIIWSYVVLRVCISAILQMTATVNSVWYGVSCRIKKNYIHPPMSPIHKQNQELRSGAHCALRVTGWHRLHSWVCGLNARNKTPMYEMPLIYAFMRLGWGFGVGVSILLFWGFVQWHFVPRSYSCCYMHVVVTWQEWWWGYYTANHNTLYFNAVLKSNNTSLISLCHLIWRFQINS